MEKDELNIKFEDKEITYEDYQKMSKDILENWSKDISKEQFNTLQEYLKKLKDFQNKIDELASNYVFDVPNKQLHGYYDIMEYCFKQIRDNDERYNTEVKL